MVTVWSNWLVPFLFALLLKTWLLTVSSGRNVTAGTRLKFHLHSLVLSAGLSRARGITDVPRCHVDEGKKIGNSRIIQQQHDGVELFPGSVISPERNNEVIKAVPRRLDWHDDELVFKAVSLRILKTAVPAALCADRYVRRLWVMGRDAFERRRPPTWSSRKQQNGAFSTNRWHKVGELPMYGELGG